MYGLPSWMSLTTFVLTLSSPRSQASPVSGSLVVRSSDHPGLKARPPYARSPASCTILGGLYTSAMSDFTWRNHLAASLITSSTLMFRFSGRDLYRVASGTKSGWQSSITLPVSTSLTILLRTSASHGPDLLVVISLPMPMNVRAHMPDPICLHSSSSLGTRLPKILCSGPWR